MELLFSWPVWILLSVFVVLVARIALVNVLNRKLSLRSSFLAAYGLFPLFLLTGFFLVVASGMQMYGFDANDQGHWFGFVILYFSPFGLPLVLGAPVVLLLDFMRKPWRRGDAV